MSVPSHLFVTEDEIRRAHEVVAHHTLPDFVSGYRIEFGEFDGDPALWVLFEMSEDVAPGEIDTSGRYSDRLKRRLDEMTALSSGVRSELLDMFLDRFPYVRYVLAADQVTQ